MHDKIEDIFQHTDSKVAEVMKQITRVYNKKDTNRMDPVTDPQI